MTGSTKRNAERDMDPTAFGKILSRLRDTFDTVEIVVFHDSLGETIDYSSHCDPYLTRIMGAHLGLIYESAKSRTKWLGFGKVLRVDTYSADRECLTVFIADDTCVTIVARPGTIDQESFNDALSVMRAQLMEEAGY